MDNFVFDIIERFQSHGNPKVAQEQSNYMRNRFEFFGLKTQERRQLQREFLLTSYLPPKSQLRSIVTELWSQPQRELHYVAQELVKKYVKQQDQSDIELYEFMVTHNSWWDTVDFIAAHLMGAFFKTYPELKDTYCKKWLNSNNMWLQRCAILFQLKYKDQVDTKLLSHVIESLSGSKEFFINKAIGWMLREYSKTDPEWVLEFVSNTELSTLSRKEALRLLNKEY